MAIKSARTRPSAPPVSSAAPMPDPTPPLAAPAPGADGATAEAAAPKPRAPRPRKEPALSGGPWLDFEKPIVELEQKIAELKAHAQGENLAIEKEIAPLEARAEKLRHKVYDNLTRYQRVQLARHPKRPYLMDYVDRLVTDWMELHGDRGFADDRAIVGGLGRFHGEPLLVVGTQKGRDTKENLLRRFGMANPEGYRKALRLMQLAGNFGMPIVSLVDTAGAFPGLGAEERGQAEAIARNLREMSRLEVPFVSVITGEGGSGGALALAMGDVVLMFENSIYSVISPEGCASILWRDRSRSQQAADALRLTAADCLELGIVDAILPEPTGGAHRDPEAAARTLGDALARSLSELRALPVRALVARRRAKFRAMGVFSGG